MILSFLPYLCVLGAGDGPLSVEEALASFRLAPGVSIDCVAAEPLVFDPVAIAFDEAGRLFVVENRGYPEGAGEGKPPAGTIALLEDPGPDGRYRKRTDFAVDLTFPNGVMVWRGGLYVTCAPDILYLKDTDGDGKADERRVVFTGFSLGGSSQLRCSHPTLAIDNWIYVSGGLSGGKVHAPARPDLPRVDIDRSDFRFRPDGGAFEAVEGKGQFGLAFDAFGRRFFCMNRIQIQQPVLPGRYLARNSHLAFSETVQNLPEGLAAGNEQGPGAAARIFPISKNVTTADSHEGSFTAACGVTIYGGTALPPEYRGCAFSCDPTGNLVHCDRLIGAGATFRALPFAEGVEFLASTDVWFRPVNLSNGPDGALYVCDMYRGTIEHPVYLPPEVRKRTDFASGRDRGRIYRVAARGRGFERVGLADLSTEPLCALLDHPDVWRRGTAQRLLIERGDTERGDTERGDTKRGNTARGNTAAIDFLAAANEILRSGLADRPAIEGAVGRLHRLFTLQWFGSIDDDSLLRKALADPHPAAREHALRWIEPHHLLPSPDPIAWLDRLLPLAGDPDPRVRFQLALTLGEAPEKRRVLPALASIAARDAADRWTRAAVLSSVAGMEGRLLGELLPILPAEASGAASLFEELGRILGASESLESLPEFLDGLSGHWPRGEPDSEVAFLTGLAESLGARGVESRGGSVFFSLLERKPEIASRGVRKRIETHRTASIARSRDLGRPLDQRIGAVRFLGHAGGEGVEAVLISLLDSHLDGAAVAPPALQSAAVRALAGTASASVAPELLSPERFGSLSPGVRDSVLSAFLARPRHHGAILAAMESGAVDPGLLDAARRGQILQSPDGSIRERAKALYAGRRQGDRMKVYEEFRSVLALKPDPKNGRAVFKTHCATCHRLDREGFAVGPDLFGIRSQPPEAILLHTLVPEYEMAPGYTCYTVLTRDRRTLVGLIASETAVSLTLRRAQGEEETVLRRDIETVSALAVSLMPQELEKKISRQELADLMAYVRGEASRE